MFHYIVHYTSPLIHILDQTGHYIPICGQLFKVAFSFQLRLLKLHALNFPLPSFNVAVLINFSLFGLVALLIFGG